jgi:hypothetical protein
MGRVGRQKDGYVLRRVVSGKVLMSSYHTTVGPVFWDRISNPKCNVPDHYGLTTYVVGAERFRPGYADIEGCIAEIWACNQSQAYLEEDFTNTRGVGWAQGTPASDFEIIAKLAGVGTTVADIATWFRNALWIEVPAPPTLFFLRRYDGGLGFRSEWTENFTDAFIFEEPRLLPSRVLGDIRQHGELVESAVANGLPRDLASTRRDVNHSLEADVAWTLFRHGLGRPADLSHRALQHAGTAGWIFEEEGDDHVSAHIGAWPELVAAFQMGRALQKSMHARTAHLRA